MKKINGKAAVNNRGLAKMEMIAAVIIMLVLLALAVPKFMDINAKTKEGGAKYNLARMRSAIAAYYGDNAGVYPTDNLKSLVPRYIEKIPAVSVKGYPSSGEVHTGKPAGQGGWFYFNDKNDPRWGDVIVDIDDTDITSRHWREN